MVEYDEIVRPHVRMWQFARCVTGNTETVSKRRKSSGKQPDFCQANEVSRTNDEEVIMPQGELNKIC